MTSRIISQPNADELAKEGILGCIMVDLDFVSGHLYLNDGFHDCVYAGHTYSPLGQFGGIDAVDEGLDQIARPIKLILSGVDASIVYLAQDEVYQNRSVVVYLGLINQSSGALTAPPETVWEGRMDFMQIDTDRNLGSITLNCEHRLRREPRIARYTDADQQQVFAGDTFFNYTPTIEGFKSNWGNETVGYSGPSRSTPNFGPGTNFPWHR